VHNTINTEPLSSIFPFISFDLSSNEGILYGINRHNNSLVLFDRFSLENSNFTIFAKSGAGKSFLVKIEALRSLMLGTDVIVLDPENEYKSLAQSVGGAFFNISLSSPNHINPFYFFIFA
jgi:type IV secretory pathway VirB4 component